jgi:hypothetical protein
LAEKWLTSTVPVMAAMATATIKVIFNAVFFIVLNLSVDIGGKPPKILRDHQLPPAGSAATSAELAERRLAVTVPTIAAMATATTNVILSAMFFMFDFSPDRGSENAESYAEYQPVPGSAATCAELAE